MRCPTLSVTAGKRVVGHATTRVATLLALMVLVCGSDAIALGLGALRTQSALNQPFYGEIALSDVAPDELDNVKASLASRSAFDQAGVPRPHFLTQLQFTPTLDRGGQPMIQVLSREPIREPYLDVMVEVIWPGGRLVKEYAVLLDPPAIGGGRRERISRPRPTARAAQPDSNATRPSPFMEAASQPGSPAPGSSAAPVGEDQNRPGTTDGPATTAGVSGAAALRRRVDAPAAIADTEFPLRYGPVPPGAGLSRVAREIAPPGATVEQTALALYRNNQQAFVGGDINRLALGAELAIPSAAELFVLDPDAARRVFRDALAGRAVARAPLTDADVELRIATRGEDAAGGDDSTGAEARPSPAASTDPAETPSADAPAPQVQALESELLLMREASESNRQEATELRDRIQTLEAQLSDIQRLLELRNQQLAQLALAGTLFARSGARAPGTDADMTSANDGAEQGQRAALASADDGGETPAAADAPSAQPTEQAAAASPQTGAAPSQTSALPQASDDFDPIAAMAAWHAALPAWALPGAAVALLLALLGLRMQRRRRDAQPRSPPQPVEEQPPIPAPMQPPVPGLEAGSPEPPAKIAAASVPAAVETAAATGSRSGAEADSAERVAVVAAPAAAPEASDAARAESLAEADIYLAYGRYRDAERVLQELAATESSPALRYKLAEVYLAAGDRAGLAELAEQMRANADPALDAERWARVEAGLQKRDEPPIPNALRDAPGPHGEPPETIIAPAPEPEFEPEAQPAREAAPEPEAASAPGSAIDASSAQLPLDDARAAAAPRAASPDDLEPDDLFLDLDDLDDLEAIPDPRASVSSASEGGARRTASAGPEATPASSSDETLELDLAALGAMSEQGVDAPEWDPNAQPRAADAAELPALDGLPEPASDRVTDDEPVLVAPAYEPAEPAEPGAVPAAEPTASQDDARWPLEPADWDEVALKLDLARAYLDMGDPEAAARFLRDAAAEAGDEHQQDLDQLRARLEATDASA